MILFSRCGERRAKAEDRVLPAGYSQVYGIAEGFACDSARGGAQDGHRLANGWKNAGLPRTYKLEKAKMYFVK